MINTVYKYQCRKCSVVHIRSEPIHGDWVCPCGFENRWHSNPQADETRQFDTGATRGKDDNKLDYEGFLSPLVLKRFAEYMHECRLRDIPPGDAIRASDNWQKGIPLDAYMKSLIRHVVEAWTEHRERGAGKVDEAVLCAIMFNVMGYLFETLLDGKDRPVKAAL